MVLGTEIRRGRGYQWRQGQGINGCSLTGVDLGRFVSILGITQDDCLIDGLVGLQ